MFKKRVKTVYVGEGVDYEDNMMVHMRWKVSIGVDEPRVIAN